MMGTSAATTSEASTLSSNEPVIKIAGIRKSFGSQEVLKNVSLQLYTGENLVVLGKSGSGKSVLIKCIVRLLRPDSGTI
ncbi:MAG: ATP-binding cassette domain-containing protein, partial [Chitinispirillaceae bacterium]|nr:ATP-binding cassette domain-containing protein [Chitinispirillaceae bacterium]